MFFPSVVMGKFALGVCTFSMKMKATELSSCRLAAKRILPKNFRVQVSVRNCNCCLVTFVDGTPSLRRRVATNKVRLPMLNWTPISSQSDATAFFKVRLLLTHFGQSHPKFKYKH